MPSKPLRGFAITIATIIVLSFIMFIIIQSEGFVPFYNKVKTSNFTSPQYLGCYNDNDHYSKQHRRFDMRAADIDEKGEHIKPMTVSECRDWANLKNQRYFGLQGAGAQTSPDDFNKQNYKGECWIGNDLEKIKSLGESDNCWQSNIGEMYGTISTNAVYKSAL